LHERKLPSLARHSLEHDRKTHSIFKTCTTKNIKYNNYRVILCRRRILILSV